MKHSEHTIPYISQTRYELLYLLVEHKELSCAQIVSYVEKGTAPIDGVLKNKTGNYLAVELNRLVYVGLLLRHATRKGTFVVKSCDKMAELLSLIGQIGSYGTVRKQNTILNIADLFLRECSPDNSSVSGAGGYVHDTLNHTHHTHLTWGDEWMERRPTRGLHLTYRLTDECHQRVLIWREIARLYAEIQNTGIKSLMGSKRKLLVYKHSMIEYAEDYLSIAKT